MSCCRRLPGRPRARPLLLPRHRTATPGARIGGIRTSLSPLSCRRATNVSALLAQFTLRSGGLPRGASEPRGRILLGQPRPVAEISLLGDHPVADGADALDSHLDQVAWL